MPLGTPTFSFGSWHSFLPCSPPRLLKVLVILRPPLFSFYLLLFFTFHLLATFDEHSRSVGAITKGTPGFFFIICFQSAQRNLITCHRALLSILPSITNTFDYELYFSDVPITLLMSTL